MQVAKPTPATPLTPLARETAPGAAAATPDADPGAFARLLSSHKQQAARPADTRDHTARGKQDAAGKSPAGAHAPKETDADEAPAQGSSAARRSAGKAAPRAGTVPRARDAAAKDAPAEPAVAAASDETPTADDTERDSKAASDAPPALAEFLATLNLPAPPAVAAAVATEVAAAVAQGGDAAAAPAAGTARHDDAARGTRGDKPADLVAVPLQAATEADTDRRIDEEPMAHGVNDKERIDAPAPLHAAEANPLAALQPAPRSDGASAAAPLQVSLPTPATAPEFREALGVQVSVLARDGVQHAELHLNPAEMGPISVQIALDGTKAQVDFGADTPATRQIIESGLPELAAALRDAGFTLQGGGVSQHARGRGDGDGREGQSRKGSGRGRIDAADEVAGSTRRIDTRLPMGAIDLYA